MKKLALLLVGVLLLLSLSSVFATEENVLLIAPAPESGEENVDESGEDMIISEDAPESEIDNEGEEIVEKVEEDISGNSEEVVTTGENTEEVPTTTSTEEEASTTSSNENTTSKNGSIIGAIIAVVIVIAVVAIAAILRKD